MCELILQSIKIEATERDKKGLHLPNYAYDRPDTDASFHVVLRLSSKEHA